MPLLVLRRRPVIEEIATELGMTEDSATVKRFKCAKYLKDKFHLG